MSFNFMDAVTTCSDFGAPKIKSLFPVSPSICHEVMGPGAMILVFFTKALFHLIKVSISKIGFLLFFFHFIFFFFHLFLFIGG